MSDDSETVLPCLYITADAVRNMNVNEAATPNNDPESETSFLRPAALGRNSETVVTFPLSKTSRKKPKTWPLALRFGGSAIQGNIALVVFLHGVFTALVVCLDMYLGVDFGLPTTIVPALSIVVGLMLVFRNQSSYMRFWDGRNHMTMVITSVRNLSRSFLSSSYKIGQTLSDNEKADIECTVRVLMAIPSTIKNHLRGEFGIIWAEQDDDKSAGAVIPRLNTDYIALLPLGLKMREDEGLGLPVELSCLIEGFIKRGVERGWFHPPQASQLSVQVNNLIDAYGKMETIHTTRFPVALLIHQRQVLALFGEMLPFAIVHESRWWSILIVSLVMFTFYGIETIASQLEDPFGYDRNDIPMDDVVEDARIEINAILREWRMSNQGKIQKQMFLYDT